MSSISRETAAAYYRTSERRLMHLTNEELKMLFEMRVDKVIGGIPLTYWENDLIISPDYAIKNLGALYEVMLEIQARYPKEQVIGNHGSGNGPYFDKLLPVPEYDMIDRLMKLFRSELEGWKSTNKIVYGLREL